MVELSPQEKPEETVHPQNPPAAAENAETAGGMRELRALLLGEDRDNLERLQAWLDDPRRRAEDISQILPESISLRARRDKKLTRALAPTVEEALNISVRRNPGHIVDAIFPVIGPAIRRAISSALKELVQGVNQALEYSLSLKGLKWRLEALRTGKTFAEVVMSHTLLFRVEQVFLIHRDTGLLLHHVAASSIASPVESKDADMVSGMLTAIQDFVRDSFGSGEGDALESLEVGDLDVWIEQGPKALLAAVIRGDAPQEFRAVLQEAVELIHLQQAEALEAFQGDAAPFEASRPLLEACLQTRLEEREKRTSPLLWATVIVVLLALGVWIFFAARDNWRWRDYVARLSAEPGLVVVSQEKSGGKYRVTGLRDPLAADPQRILQSTPIDPAAVVSRWEMFQSSHPDFVLERARTLLQPPDQVRLRFADGVLGAEGFAPQAWITDARRLAAMLPAVTEFNAGDLVSIEQVSREIEALRERIENLSIRFAVGSAEITTEQHAALDNLAAEAKRLMSLTLFAKKTAAVAISGHTDRTGSEGVNQRLEQERAANVLAALTARGIGANNLSVASGRESVGKARDFERKVTVKVTVADDAKP